MSQMYIMYAHNNRRGTLGIADEHDKRQWQIICEQTRSHICNTKKCPDILSIWLSGCHAFTQSYLAAISGRARARNVYNANALCVQNLIRRLCVQCECETINCCYVRKCTHTARCYYTCNLQKCTNSFMTCVMFMGPFWICDILIRWKWRDEQIS